MKGQPAGVCAAILTSIAWGGQFPIMGALLNVMDPFWFTTIRYAGASAILLFLLYAIEGRDAFRFGGRERAVVLLGALSIAGFNIFVLEGIRLSGPAHGGLIVALSPLFSAVLLWFRTGARPKTITLTMIAVAILGVALVITKGRFATLLHHQSGIGDLFVAIGVLSISAYAVGSAEFSDWTPLRFTTLSVGLGTVVAVAATLLATIAGMSHIPTLPWDGAFAAQMAYMIGVSAVFAYLSWNFAVARIGPQRAVLFMNLVPIVTFTIELFLGQRFALIEYAGAALTILALIANNIATRPDRYSAAIDASKARRNSALSSPLKISGG